MIRHILRDGTEVHSIRGKVIKAQEIKAVYQLVEKINRRNGGKYEA